MSLAKVVNENLINMHDCVSIIAQNEEGVIIKQGLDLCPSSAIGINPQLGLVVLADATQGRQQEALKSVEILLDDMQLNLPAVLPGSYSAATASSCLLESLNNINEYLYTLSQQDGSADKHSAVSLIAAQFLQHQCSVMAVGRYNCLLLHQDQLVDLDTVATNNLPGKDHSILTLTSEQDLHQGDILLLVASSVVALIGQEFIRVTLSRFRDNLDMVLRQINIRVARQGMPSKPAIIICKMLQSRDEERGWLAKWRKRSF